MQTVRAVYAADQRTHVRRGAGASDENKIAVQPFASDAIAAKKIARRLNDIIRVEYGDVHAGEQADESSVIGIERDADRSGAGNGGERIGDAEVGGGEFGFAATRENTGQPLACGKEFGSKIGGRRYGDAARIRRCAQNGASQLFGLLGDVREARNAFDRCGGGARRGLKRVEGIESVHKQNIAGAQARRGGTDFDTQIQPPAACFSVRSHSPKGLG
ncbi:MAG: hypothetical protein WBF35_13150, partial [Candidatus Acidiferrales bacterium]